jgi:hypothetical protein
MTGLLIEHKKRSSRNITRSAKYVLLFIEIRYILRCFVFQKVTSDMAVEKIYTAWGHGFPNLTARGLLTVGISGQHMTQEGVLSLVVVLGSSVSLVGLVFAFITYR